MGLFDGRVYSHWEGEKYVVTLRSDGKSYVEPHLLRVERGDRCEYCRVRWVPDARGTCSCCGAPG